MGKNTVQQVVTIVGGTAMAVVGAATGNPFLFLAGGSQLLSGLRGLDSNNAPAKVFANPIDPTVAIPAIYGESRVGVKFTDFRKHPTEGDILYAVGAICLGPVADVTKIYFDDTVVVTDPVTDGSLSTSNVIGLYGSDKLKYAVHLGGAAQVNDSELAARFGAAWPATSDGRRIAYLVLRLKYDKSVFPRGVPNVTVVVQGRTLYDPRDASTAYSVNPALAIRDYLSDGMYGCGVDASELDDDSFEDCANFCEETVNTTAYVGPRFTCNGIVDTGLSRKQNMDALRTACRGQLVYQGGRFRLVIHQVETPTTFELNEDNIVGDWEIKRLGSVPNAITATFVDPALQHQAREVSWPEAGAVNGFLAADNGILQAAGIDLPFTQNIHIAQQIGMVLVREGRNDLVIAVTAKQEALKLQYGEVVPVTHSTPGLEADSFRVLALGILPDAHVRLALQSYDDSAYTLDTQNTDDPPAATDLPNPNSCAAPTSLTLESDSGTALLAQDGQYLPRIQASWTASPEPFLSHYEVQWKRAVDGAWIAAPAVLAGNVVTFIWPVANGVTHDVRVRAVNTLGVPSTWLSGSITVSTMPVPKLESASIGYDASGNILVNYSVNEAAQTIYANGQSGSAPPDPDAGDHDATASTAVTKSGVLNTGIPVAIGATGYANVTVFEPISGITVGVIIQARRPAEGDSTPEMLTQSIDFSTTGEIIANVTGNSKTVKLYVNAGAGTPPAVPTAGAHDAVVNARTGIVSTGISVGRGELAYIYARGEDSLGNLGTAILIQLRRAMDNRKPSVSVVVTPASFGSGAVALTIKDLDLCLTAVEFKKKIGSGAFDVAWQTAWDSTTGTIGSSTSIVRSEAITTSDPDHNSEFMWQFKYTDVLGNVHTEGGSQTFDVASVPNILSAGISFNGSNEVSVSVKANDDTASAYLRVGNNSAPADPTSASYDATGASANFTVNTGIVVPIGNEAYVKVRGYGAGGIVAGFVSTFRRINDGVGGTTTPVGVSINSFYFLSGTAGTVGSPATNTVGWDVTAPSGHTVKLTRYMSTPTYEGDPPGESLLGTSTGLALVSSDTASAGGGYKDPGSDVELVYNYILEVMDGATSVAKRELPFTRFLAHTP